MYSGVVVNLLNLCGNYLLIGGNLGFPGSEPRAPVSPQPSRSFPGMLMILFLTAETEPAQPVVQWIVPSH